MGKHAAIIISVFIASLSSLAYEIILIRIFSISLWYHFAFMVISIAMLGIGASGTLLAVYPRLKNMRNMPFYFLMLSLGIPLSYLLINVIPFEPERLSWDRVQIFYISLYYVFVSFPFFVFGLILSTAFSNLRENTGHIYFADLTGAGTGSVLAIFFLSLFGAEKIVFIISLISIVAVLIYGNNKKIRLAAFVLIIVSLSVLYFHPAFIDVRISPYKPLKTALRFPGAEHIQTYNSPFSQVDVFKSPASRFAPGLSFRYLKNLPEQTGIAVDSSEIYAITKDSNKKELDFIRYLPAALPYEISGKNTVLILEPKGGLSALTAEYYNAENIYKIDSNPTVIKAVKEYSWSFSTDIYDSNTLSAIGRSYLFSSNKTFDIIDISVMGSMPSSSFGFSEDYRFTVEAFVKYIEHLNPNGILAVNLFIIPPPRTELRLINTLAEAFERLKIEKFDSHVAAIRSWGTITFIVKKSELSRRDINKIKDFASDRRFDLVYYPGIAEKETNLYIKTSGNELFNAFKSLMFSESRNRFIKDYMFDISPVNDENPFFHYYLKFKNIKEIYKLMGGKWQYFVEEGYLLPVIFLQVMFLSLLLMILPAFKLFRKNLLTAKPACSLLYFVFLGIGFMFVEISFIQRMILPLENPSYAAASVIASMLISSGAGSLLSQHFEMFRRARIILLVSFIILLYSLFLPYALNMLYQFSMGIKIILVFLMLLPAGVFMGMPFPIGLSFLCRRDPALIPWAWAVNGCFSVLAPILAVMLAISTGFKLVIIAGVLVYFSAFVSFLKMNKS